MITVQILSSGIKMHDDTTQDCLQTMQQIESYYKGQVSMNIESHSYGCSVIIRNTDSSPTKTIHPQTNAINTPEQVVN